MPIKVEHLSYTYQPKSPNEVKALDDISFSIRSKELVGIVGHTGSGKSTLIQHLNGLIKPDTGRVIVDDMEITKKTKDIGKIRAKVGLVFQYPEYQLFEETVEKDIEFGPRNLGITGTELTKRVKWAMDMVNLDYMKFKDLSPFELSGGEKRRVAIAGVIAMVPKYLILDEPCAGLDPLGVEGLLNTLHKLNDKGMAIIMVSHSMDEVARLCNRLIVINDGKIIFDDNIKKVFSHNDEMIKAGLDIPEVMKLMLDLKESGIDINTDVITVDEAVAEIKKVWPNA